MKLGIILAGDELLEGAARDGVEEEEDTIGYGHMLRTGGILTVTSRLKVLAGIVIEDQVTGGFSAPHLLNTVDEGLGQFCHSAVPIEFLIQRTFQVGFGQCSILRGVGREQTVHNVIQHCVTGGIRIEPSQSTIRNGTPTHAVYQGGQVIRLTGGRSPHDGEDVLLRVQVIRRQFAAAVRARQIRAGYSLFIQCLATGVEARCPETLHAVTA